MYPIDQINTNEYVQAHHESNDKQSVLARYDKQKKELTPVTPPSDAMGIRPANLEQHFAFDLLMNPNINIITLYALSTSRCGRSTRTVTDTKP